MADFALLDASATDAGSAQRAHSGQHHMQGTGDGKALGRTHKPLKRRLAGAGIRRRVQAAGLSSAAHDTTFLQAPLQEVCRKFDISPLCDTPPAGTLSCGGADLARTSVNAEPDAVRMPLYLPHATRPAARRAAPRREREAIRQALTIASALCVFSSLLCLCHARRIVALRAPAAT